MELIWSILNILVFLFALSVIIFLHELGHFIAAKSVGIRATQFAIGFGQAILSYRKGIGLRLGSTEKTYRKRIHDYLAKRNGDANDDSEPEASEPETTDVQTSEGELNLENPKVTEAEQALGLGETEYRFNWIPLGGYVKMLGQEDLDPAARSEHPRSFNTKPIWARFVVISAGVVMNLVTAVGFFIGAFMIGVAFPPAIVGDVNPGSPAATTEAQGQPEVVGLQPGDRIVSVDGEAIGDFQELALASALADPQGATVVVDRPNVGQLTFRMEPTTNPNTGMLSLGIAPPTDVVLAEVNPNRPGAGPAMAMFEQFGVKPGSRLTAVNGEPIDAYHQYRRVIRDSNGQPVQLTFTETDRDPADQPADEPATYTVIVHPQTGFMTDGEPGAAAPTSSHLLGLVPATEITQVAANAPADGKLRPGDVVAQAGSTIWPDIDALQRAIRGAEGKVTFKVIGRDGNTRQATITPSGGTVGIVIEPTRRSLYLSRLLERFTRPKGVSPPDVDEQPNGDPAERDADATAQGDAEDRSHGDGVTGRPAASDADTDTDTDAPGRTPGAFDPSGLHRRLAGEPSMSSPFADLPLNRGARLQRVAGEAVATFRELRIALQEAGAGRTSVTYSVPVPAGVTDTGEITLSDRHVEALMQLPWTDPLARLFQPLEVPQRAANPIEAAVMGFQRSWMFAEQQYLTIARMIQGSVPVDAANGPVMITAAGARFVERGFSDVLWFMGLISVALAVMNFLPIPVVDGGHAVLLLIEKVRGKPLPANVQGAIMLVGIAMLLFVFVYVTYNDITKLMSM